MKLNEVSGDPWPETRQTIVEEAEGPSIVLHTEAQITVLGGLFFLQMESPAPWPVLSQLWPWHCHTNGGLRAA